ncbi:thioredoxin-like domain-containing protein [Paraflavitalea sp. CAU 1676]|uniref:TlpA family protein disulfide reductase n=1 Tax=Paraflavitalea sp. CAU 1676 TaxID=3032598 RepID=UPI0023DB88F4|nr:thioredoxin-like domain-containing protein [Paraflavitalea sp. CAU 1676]MDF2190531.1 thioredoxin-like domain-containing protein [Paraflavitalea sp. CAU 1676]
MNSSICSIYILVWIAGIVSCAERDKRPTIAEFEVLQIDSATKFNTRDIPGGKPVALVYFSPDCDHCQSETADWIRNMDSLKNVNFYFITHDPLERLRVFREYYKTDNYPNFHLGWDYQYSFLKLYKPTATPYFVLYDKKKKLKVVHGGEVSASMLLSFLKDI